MLENAFIAKMGMRENAFIAKMGSCENALVLQKKLNLVINILPLAYKDLHCLKISLSSIKFASK